MKKIFFVLAFMLIGTFAFANTFENSYFQKDNKTFEAILNDKVNEKIQPNQIMINIDCNKLSQEVGTFLEKNSSISQWRIDIVVEVVRQVCEAVK